MSAMRLVVEKGRSKGKTLRLKPNGTVVLGRDQGNQLVISDVQASRKHLQIEAKLGEFELRDLGSSNGTFVNGERVEKRVLAPGDKIQVGDTLVYFLEQAPDGEHGAERRGDLSGREISGYRIGRLLGRGAMGTVYEAVQISLERKVAFKVLSPELAQDPEFIERFIAEARAAGRLNHANIVAVYDVGQHDELRFFSMEYMEGGSVEDLLRREGGKLTVERSIPIIFDAARGLEFAEKHGVIHRDIKPDNLMLGTDDVVKICDLGIATQQAQQDPGVQQQISGSPQYIAPEHAQGKPIDHRVDLYSLGITWYQLLVGETPFSAGSAKEVILKQIHEEPPPLEERAPHVGEDVRAVIRKLMAKDPEQRIPSARQLQADLAELARRYALRDTVLLRLDALAPSQPPSQELAETAPAAEAAPQPLRLPKGVFWALLGLIAAGLLVGGFLITRSIVHEDEQARLEAAQEDLRVVRALVDEGDLDEASRLAAIAASRLRADGLDEHADEAERIAREAREKQVRDREDAAARELRRTRGLAESYLEGDQAPDPESAARLEEVVRALNDLAGNYPGTSAAGEAVQLARELTAQLLQIREQQAEVAEHIEEATDELKRAKGRIDDLFEQGRFTQARERAEEFLAAYPDVSLKGADTLLTEVRLRAERHVQDLIREAASLQALRQDWDGARDLLERQRGEAGFPELEAELEGAVRQVGEARAAARRQQVDELRRRDARLLDDLREKVRESLRARRFGEAVDAVGLETAQFEVREVRGEYEAWISRLRGAERAVVRFLDAVESGRLSIALEVEFVPGRGLQRGRVIEVDRGKRVLVLEGERKGVLAELALDDPQFPVGRLLDWLEQLAPSSAERLDLACLAYELGERARGQALLIEIDTARLGAEDRQRHKTLLLLQTQERR